MGDLPEIGAFASLLDEVRACTICAGYLPHDPRPVFQIHPSAKILIAGQAPGRKVHESGVPFNDVSGDRLRVWLGVTREEFYDPQLIALLPMGFCFSGTGRSGDLPPRPECAATWRDRMLSTLHAVELTVVLGQYAQAYHFDEEASSVTERVKSWRTQWPGKIPLPHPSPRNILWVKRNPWFESDLLPALRQRVAQLLGR
ncbi:MAG: uracil-DNA glycosylase family protein [Betaproteobacteria bacterium]|nr:uracil-DNA glycosylase family protein [Betaproteobacteria bacterium]